MPRRFNFFQDVVSIIYRHMAGDAEVKESEEPRHSLTGSRREVDVTIHSRVAGMDVTIGVEAVSTRRKANVEWVERILMKHSHLPTDKLVLVSKSGFTEDAKQIALAHKAVVLSPEDVAPGEALPSVVVNRLRSLWAKTVSFSIQSVGVTVELPDFSTVHLSEPPPTLDVVIPDSGLETLRLETAIKGALFPADPRERFKEFGLADIGESCTKNYTFSSTGLTANVNGVEHPVYLRYQNAGATEMHRIVLLYVSGECQIVVNEVPLTHVQFGPVLASYGETEMAGNATAIVVTLSGDEEKLTVRVRDQVGGEPVDHDTVLQPRHDSLD